MPILKTIEPYEDDSGNRIEFDGTPINAKVNVKFEGSNNVLRIADSAKIVALSVSFFGNNGTVEIGPTTKSRTGLRFGLAVGEQSNVRIGPNVGAETKAFIRASEGASVLIGADCMFASNVEIRTDDTHAIYDMHTGKRTNPARDISIGEHVWIGKHAAVFGGVSIGSGAVVGFRSIVTKDVPNNSVAAGAPAKIVRKDIAWERPTLSTNVPGTEDVPPEHRINEAFWSATQESEPVQVEALPTSLFTRLRRRVGRFLAK